MPEQQKQFEIKLPARITGLVFWGLVFIGLLVAVIILQRSETDLVSDNKEESLIITYRVEEIVETFPDPPVLKRAAGRIRSAFAEHMDEYGFHALRLTEGSETLSIGSVQKDDDVYEYTVHYFPRGDSNLHEIAVQIYGTNIHKALANMRKQILLSIGIGVFMFGLLLQRILQKMLSRPFHRMVDTAEQFSMGNEDVRFDDERQDEFGYLGKFINNAIDAIIAHRNDIEAALARASASEAALNIEKERAEVTLKSITDTVLTVDTEGRITYLNPAGELLFGVKKEDVYGRHFNDVCRIVEENSGEIIENPLARCFNSGEIVTLPEHSSLISERNTMISIEASIASMMSDSGELLGAVIVIQDVSHTRRLTRQLSYQASHDLLTGLYNRRKFEEHLEEILSNVREEDKQHALFYLDLDNFKIVNDTCGHVAGDELLKQLPSLFEEVLRSGDIIARLGGDEFGIILENCGLQKAVGIADKVRQKIKAYRFIWDDRTFDIGVSIGVIGINADYCEMSHVLSSADIACYAAKDAGRNRVHVYEPSDEVVNERYGQMHWTARISRALEEQRFQLYQQPIVGVSDRSQDHLEILLRMVDEEGAIIPPGAFIPAAERYGLMPEIDRWVIREVFNYLGDARLHDKSTGAQRVLAINLSGDSINDSNLLDYIFEQQKRYGILLHEICFEITETVAISNLTKATAFINALKEHGCRFSLDDFGSGLSSFAYLKSLPVNYLKIDGGFIKEISRDRIDRAMVESIQQIGSVMQLDTIAEHVEDEATLKVLDEIGIDYAQGYFLGRPQLLDAS